jgi:hypothetical protein
VAIVGKEEDIGRIVHRYSIWNPFKRIWDTDPLIRSMYFCVGSSPSLSLRRKWRNICGPSDGPAQCTGTAEWWSRSRVSSEILSVRMEGTYDAAPCSLQVRWPQPLARFSWPFDHLCLHVHIFARAYIHMYVFMYLLIYEYA